MSTACWLPGKPHTREKSRLGARGGVGRGVGEGKSKKTTRNQQLLWCPHAFIMNTSPLTGSLAVALWDGLALLRNGGKVGV